MTLAADVRRLVIIGGSDAGISAGLRARQVAPDVDVKIVLADGYPNFSICGLPFYVSGETADWHNLAHRSLDDLVASSLHIVLHTMADSFGVHEATNRSFITKASSQPMST